MTPPMRRCPKPIATERRAVSDRRRSCRRLNIVLGGRLRGAELPITNEKSEGDANYFIRLSVPSMLSFSHLNRHRGADLPSGPNAKLSAAGLLGISGSG